MTWADTLEAKGMEKGRLEGMCTLVADLLERQFEPLSEETKARLGAIASADELFRLHQRVLEAESLAALGL